MFTHACYAEIYELKANLEKLKKDVENEIIPCYFAKSKVYSLLKTEKRLKIFLQEMRVGMDEIYKLDDLISETSLFLKDIIDLIDIERSKCF